MAQLINNPNGGINSGAFTNLGIDMSKPAYIYKPVYKNGSDFNKQREIERQQNIALEKAKMDAVMLEKNPNYNSLTDKVFGKQEGWSFTRAFRLGGYTILGVILGRYVAKNMGKSTNLGMVIGGVLPYVAYKLSLEYDKKQFSKQPQQAPKQPVDISNLTNINLGGGKDKFGMPRVTEGSKEEWKAIELGLKVDKLPDEFIVKSNGNATRYYKVKGTFGSTLYMIALGLAGTFGTGSPIKISNDEFLKAYDIFLKQPK